MPNGTNTIVLPLARNFHIRLCVWDELDQEIMAGVPYAIRNEADVVLFEGETDNQGRIQYDQVNLQDYTLFIGAYRKIIPAGAQPEDYYHVYLPPLGYFRLGVYDREEKPIVGESYEIRRNGILIFEGKTDGQGKIQHDWVPLQDYTLCILHEKKTIGPVAYEEATFSVFLECLAGA